MKWKDFRSWMNEYFDDEDEIRLIATSKYPIITIITHEESEDDDSYAIFVASSLEEREEGYFMWSHEGITNFAKSF